MLPTCLWSNGMDVTPRLTVDEAKKVIIKNYEVRKVFVENYKSYSNQNFYVEFSSDSGNATKHVLRVRNQLLVDKGLELTKQAHTLQQLLFANSFNVPVPVKTISGLNCFEVEVKYSDKNVRKSVLELVNYLEGSTIADARMGPNEFYLLCGKVGTFVGKIHSKSLEMKFAENYKMNNYLFYFENTGFVKEMMGAIQNDELRTLVSKFISSFCGALENGLLHGLRKCYIHGDVSDTNILIKKENELWEIAGLIDFEDMHYGYLVSDLGICMAYMIGRGATFGSDLHRIAKIFLQHYQNENELLEKEKQVLHACILARAITSYTNGQYLCSRTAGNESSLTIQSGLFPDVIKLLMNICSFDCEKLWFEK